MKLPLYKVNTNFFETPFNKGLEGITIGGMMYLKISTYLAADLETVKSYLMTPALLNYVVAGLMKFHPIEPNFFSSKWVEGSSL